jgi:ubiquinone biosynthesis monooxygenase Coq7
MMTADQVVIEFDRALRTVFAEARSHRPTPGASLPDAQLSDAERRHVIGLMRVDHCGEICAQALYQGQALTSRDPSVREALRSAADEETEHLAWTEERIKALGGRKSLLNPLWYLGSLSLGVFAGKLGDRWNLGFLAETERQVEAHLDSHLRELPPQDQKSREIVDQMRIDEIAHAKTAVRLGAAELPAVAKAAMRLSAKLMTGTAYRL